MTTAQELRTLAERVTALTGAETHATLGSLEHNISAALGVWWMPDSQIAGPWLRSLDAAMTLVPDFVTYRRIESGGVGRPGEWHSVTLEWLDSDDNNDRRVVDSLVEAPNALPRAIAAAALLARAEQMEDTQ